MSPVDEFALIRELFAPLSAGYPGAFNLTDDAAIVDVPSGYRLALTKDVLVAGVHFFPNDPADLVARKALRVNLSDLAAMGAEPIAVLLGVCFPKNISQDWLERFARGLKSDLDAFGIALIGGDTVATPGPLTLSVTALGKIRTGCELRRSNACLGDDIWVSGTIGDAALGLFVAQGQAKELPEASQRELLDRSRLPQPRLSLGQKLVGVAHAAMDISDGLVADLTHICQASGVGAEIKCELLPLSDAARIALGCGVGQGIASVLSGGDDYELLFSAPESSRTAILALQKELGLPVSRIGRIIEGNLVRVFTVDGEEMFLQQKGYQHFQP